MTQTLLIIAVAVEGGLVVVLAILWLRSRRRLRLVRAELAATRSGHPPRRLIPGPREVVKGVWETATLVRERGFGGALRSSIDDLAGWAQVERPDLVRLAGPDGGLSILFSDIEGSTSLNESLGDRQWVKLLARHDKALRAQIERQAGHVIKTQGDGFMVAFSTPAQAVHCAIGVQNAFASPRPSSSAGRPPLRLRIGIHHGDVVHRDNDIFGRNVAQAARVAALAVGGEILVSEPVAAAVDELEGVVLAEPRAVELKGLSGEYVVTAVDWAA